MSEEKIALSLEELTAAIESSSNDSEPYINRAQYFYEKEEYDLVLNDFSKAIELNTDNLKGYKEITDYYINQKHYNLALSILTKLIEVNPNSIESSEYYSNRGVCFFYLENYISALNDFKIAIKVNPSNSDGYLGLVCDKLTNYDAAIKFYTKAIEINPNDDVLYANRASCYEKQEDYKRAEEGYEEASSLEQYPKLDVYGMSYYDYKAQEMINKRDRERIYNISEDNLKKINQEIKKNTDSSSSYINRADYYKKERNYKEAIIDYTKVIELNPNDAIAYSSRAECYKEEKKFELAIVDYDKAIELRPDFNEDYYDKYICYICYIGIDDAADEFQKFNYKFHL